MGVMSNSHFPKRGPTFGAFIIPAMGQILNKFQGEQWRRNQVRRITDEVFDRCKNRPESANLTFEDLYIAVLLIYNDINKHLSGPHFDPPSKEHVRDLVKGSDINLDGELDREEFVKFILRLSGGTSVVVGRGLLLTLLVAPALAVASKKATEGVPRIGKVVQRIPNAVYASLITLVAVVVESSTQGAK